MRTIEFLVCQVECFRSLLDLYQTAPAYLTSCSTAVIIHNEKETTMETYYHPHDLGKFAEMGKGNKELWEKFMAYYSAVFAEGALTEREKALIALAVAHAVQCPYCIDAYTQASLEKGSNIEEMTEAVHVACAIRGGASLAHGVQMRNVADKLSM